MTVQPGPWSAARTNRASDGRSRTARSWSGASPTRSSRASTANGRLGPGRVVRRRKHVRASRQRPIAAARQYSRSPRRMFRPTSGRPWSSSRSHGWLPRSPTVLMPSSSPPPARLAGISPAVECVRCIVPLQEKRQVGGAGRRQHFVVFAQRSANHLTTGQRMTRIAADFCRQPTPPRRVRKGDAGCRCAALTLRESPLKDTQLCDCDHARVG